MADPSNAEISLQLSQLRAALLESQPQPGKPPQVSALKEHLIAVSPHVVTVQWMERTFSESFFKKIDDIHEEAVKAPVTEWLEAAGLGGVAAGVEKIAEGKNFGVIWPYFASAFLGLAIPAIGLLLAAMSINIIRNITAKITGGRIIARSENGGLGLQDRNVVEDRERRIFNGGSGLADLPATANFDNLRNQLTELNPELEKFNRNAPTFRTEFGKLPKASALTKTATAVEKVSKAVSEAKPDDITAVAKATGKLAGAQKHFDPAKLPKARTLSSAADAADRLARSGQNLTEKFRSLRSAAAAAASAMSG
ncbi:hypothetical protein [Streptomyces sp. NPDC001927]